MSTPPHITDLFSTMHGNPAALSAMQSTAERLCAEVSATQGDVDIQELTGGAVFIVVTILVDNSFSIKKMGNVGELIRGYNTMLRAMRRSQEADDMLVSCQFLNRTRLAPSGVLYPYSDVEDAQLLSEATFHASGGTPLFDRLAVALTGAALKRNEFIKAGLSSRAVTVIITDGYDQKHSVLHTEDTVCEIVNNELKTERHTVAALGLRNPEAPVDYRESFARLGIMPEWILTPGDDESEIRRAFDLLSLEIASPSNDKGGTLIDPQRVGSS